MAQAVEYLLYKCKVLSSNANPTKKKSINGEKPDRTAERNIKVHNCSQGFQYSSFNVAENQQKYKADSNAINQLDLIDIYRTLPNNSIICILLKYT
jgi:hypothetical protein